MVSITTYFKGHLMKILPPEPHVDLYNEGFGDVDLLERKKVGKALSDLIDRIDDPLVIALHGQWGTGKTHFLKRWVGAHTIENGSAATKVYFDAFAHDYLNDPLPALVSALTERLPDNKQDKVQKVKAAAFKLAKPIARIGLALATFGATEALSDVGDAVVEAVSDEGAASLEKYWKEETGRREAMLEFKNAMGALATPATEGDVGSSLVFVIDELDRCRPDYALEVLEVIKHFFSVPHVHFILGVNLNALENSVEARYGGNTNGHAYLKKFIQITLELPDEIGDHYNNRSANLVYLQHLIEEMGVPAHVAKPLKSQVALVSRFNHVSMRDIGKIVSSISLASNDVLTSSNILIGWISVMIDLVILKNVRPDLYPKFLNATVNDDDFASYIGATTKTLAREIEGDHNPEYSSEIFLHYITWLYIVHDGHLKNEYSEYNQGIGQKFDRWGGLDEARKVPMKIHSKWLEQFSFYKNE